MYDSGPTYCTNCGREASPSARFCDRCGEALDPMPGGPTSAPGIPYFPPEAVASKVDFAGFWIRLGAWLIDILILAGFVLLLEFIFSDKPLSDYAIVTLLRLLMFGYHVTFVAWRGQTIGKTIVGIHVIDRNGDKPRLGRVFLREIVGKFLSGIFGLGYLWVAWHPDKQGWHDSIARTYVVRKRRE